jgi:hypothetical protein
MRKGSEKRAASKKLFFDSLSENLGLVYRAEKATGINSENHYYWCKTDPEYKKRVNELMEKKRDYVEHKLIHLVDDNESSSVQFAAKCLLRKRGYDQSTEIKNADGEKFQIEINPQILKQVLDDSYNSADK